MEKKISDTKEESIAVRSPVLGLFSLILVTVGAVASLRNLPIAAMLGGSLVFLFLSAALLFLLPSALIAAELATAWSGNGGVYLWVKSAFGDKIGFLAIWLQWLENIIWFPTILAFMAGTVGYLISPSLVSNKLFLITSIIVSFWLITIVNLLGTRSSIRFSNFCTIIGLFLPATLIIALSVSWIYSGYETHINFSFHNLLPNIKEPQFWVTLTGIMISCCGLEITTFHAHEVHNPHQNFPRALLITVLVLLVTLICGSLAIAAVLPGRTINLILGIMQTFDAFFGVHNLGWIMPFIAISLAIGSIGGVNSWIIAPIKGLFVAACDGHLPKHCQKRNRVDVPSVLLIYQAAIVTIIALAFLFLPDINGSYWMLTVLAAQLYMLMYLLMFAAAVYLRYKEPLQHRPFRIPGGNFGILLAGGMGIISAALTFLISFIPPHNINVGSAWRYEIMLMAGLIVTNLPPLIILMRTNRSTQGSTT